MEQIKGKFNLSSLLGCPSAQGGQLLYVAVHGRACDAIALEVADITGTARVPAAGPAPLEMAVPAEWVRGVARLGQRVLVVLEPSAMAVA